MAASDFIFGSSSRQRQSAPGSVAGRLSQRDRAPRAALARGGCREECRELNRALHGAPACLWGLLAIPSASFVSTTTTSLTTTPN